MMARGYGPSARASQGFFHHGRIDLWRGGGFHAWVGISLSSSIRLLIISPGKSDRLAQDARKWRGALRGNVAWDESIRSAAPPISRRGVQLHLRSSEIAHVIQGLIGRAPKSNSNGPAVRPGLPTRRSHWSSRSGDDVRPPILP